MFPAEDDTLYQPLTNNYRSCFSKSILLFRQHNAIVVIYFLFEVLYFVDENSNDILSLGSIVKLSEETIRNILCRESLGADEFVKFQVSLDLNY